MDMSIFTDTRFDDYVGIKDFLLANSIDHSRIESALTAKGYVVDHYPITDGDLTNPDWRESHDQMHQREFELVGLGASASNFVDLNPNDAQSLWDWLDRHAFAHAQVSAALGLK